MPLSNVIRIEGVFIDKPTVTWERDELDGRGTRQVITVKFKAADLSKPIQQELAEQHFANGFANLTIELLQPSFYGVGLMVDSASGEMVGEASDAETVENGAVQEGQEAEAVTT